METSAGPKWWLLYLGLAIFMILFIGEINCPCRYSSILWLKSVVLAHLA